MLQKGFHSTFTFQICKLFTVGKSTIVSWKAVRRDMDQVSFQILQTPPPHTHPSKQR